MQKQTTAVPFDHMTISPMDTASTYKTDELPQPEFFQKQVIVMVSGNDDLLTYSQKCLRGTYTFSPFLTLNQAYEFLFSEQPCYPVDAILLDIMPGDTTRGEFDTFQFLNTIRNGTRLAQTPLLLLSSTAKILEVSELQEDIERSNGVIITPFTMTILLIALDRVLNMDVDHPFCDFSDLQPFRRNKDKQLYRRDDEPRPYWTGARIGYGRACPQEWEG